MPTPHLSADVLPTYCCADRAPVLHQHVCLVFGGVWVPFIHDVCSYLWYTWQGCNF